MSVKITKALFIKSATGIANSLPEDMSEIIFIGRSNVGKSSLLNSLTSHKNLAKSSSTPGKTQLINFFDIDYKNDKNSEKFRVRFVDMPGFGYAKVSKTLKEEWHKSLTDFLKQRVSIRIFVQLIDARHFGLDIDINVNQYLQDLKRADQKIIVVLTKTDKLNQSSLSKLKNSIKKSSQFSYESMIFVSNLKNRGIDNLNKKIFELIFEF